jgi:hypothetical protein
LETLLVKTRAEEVEMEEEEETPKKHKKGGKY